MKSSIKVRTHVKSLTRWNIVLLCLVAFSIFGIGIFPAHVRPTLYNVFYTLIYFAAILALDKYHKRLFIISTVMMLVQWSSSAFDLEVINDVSSFLNFVFFGYIAGVLIKQVAGAEQVNVRVILESVNGYLLMGLIFSIVIAVIAKFDPGAINFPMHAESSGTPEVNFSDCLYYAFISITTMGYGDLVPTEAYTKSLATLIGVSGQLYVAIIIALLVGKFSNQKNS